MRRNRWPAPLLVALLACGPPATQRVELSGPVDLPADSWITFQPESLLRTPGDNSEVCLAPDSVFAIDDDAFDIRAPNGRTARLRALIVQPNGESDSLSNRAITSGYLCLGLRVAYDPSRAYTGARLHASVPVRLRHVVWLSSSP